ncbi:MAG: hypothetical protein K8F27_02815 [Sulfuricellaceae bacterium]|nr:hypothetical protein [Sulfuricellaceae bacterium]
MLGAATSEVEVSLASNKGFWLLLKDEELFVPYAEFPWFKQATLKAEGSSLAKMRLAMILDLTLSPLRG